MALGDGTTWDESAPTDATSAVQIDDYNRDIRKGTRSRMAHEHEWPASQSATAEGGKHKFLTLQEQTGKPTLSGTQIAGVYAKTDHNFYFEKSDGTEVTIVSGTAVGDGKVLANATDGNASYLGDKLNSGYLTLSGTSVVLATGAIDVYQYTSLSASSAQDAKSLKMCYGTTPSLGDNTATNITNLPFADATSYRLIANQMTNAAGADGAVSVLNVNGNTCTVVHQGANANPIQWLAIGV